MLADLSAAASHYQWLGLLWHLFISFLLAALLLGWEPVRRSARLWIALPLVSTAIVAAAAGNPFDGVVMGVTAMALLVAALRRPAALAAWHWNWQTGTGLASIAFAWAYPTFSANAASWVYAFGSPTGVLPVPTLALVIGFTLLTSAHQTRTWSTGLASVAAFYGAFGSVQLGVTLDLGLLLGSLALIIAAAPALLILPGRPGQRLVR